MRLPATAACFSGQRVGRPTARMTRHRCCCTAAGVAAFSASSSLAYMLSVPRKDSRIVLTSKAARLLSLTVTGAFTCTEFTSRVA